MANLYWVLYPEILDLPFTSYDKEAQITREIAQQQKTLKLDYKIGWE